MLTLINDDTNYTEEGLALEKRMYSFMEPLFKEYLLKGYKRHEIEYMSLFALAMHPNFSLDWLDTVTYDKLKEITIWATETFKWVACNMTMAKLK